MRLPVVDRTTDQRMNASRTTPMAVTPLSRVRLVGFTLLPAVDVADGQAVRLMQGDAGTVSAHGSARDAALAWQAQGAEWIHLVDLDAAFGRGSNAELLAAVVGELDIDVQLSGGIHDDPSLERALATGCARINLGTAALEDPAWCARVIATHGERIAIAVDVRVVEDPDRPTRHRLAARGRTSDGGDLWEVLGRLDEDGCARYVVTDVRVDGTMRGPNVELYQAIASATAAPVIASGGIASIADLVALAEVARSRTNLEGAVVGTAIYTGRFTLPEAIEELQRVDAAAT
jgi:phosphoribosylanthranilate isomerase